MKVTIYGIGGTGTSTLCKSIANKYDIYYGYTGQIFRDIANSLGLSIYEFENLQKEKPEYDKKVDEEVKQFGIDNDNFIFEGRLAWYFIPDSIKIKLECSERERGRRIAEREGISIDDAMKKTKDREEGLVHRYKLVYPNLNYPPCNSQFDFILDTSNLDTNQVLEKVVEFLDKKISN